MAGLQDMCESVAFAASLEMQHTPTCLLIPIFFPINGTVAKQIFSFCSKQSSFWDLGKLSPSRYLEETWENLASHS